VTAGLFRIVIHFNGVHLLALLGVVGLVVYVWAKAHLGRSEG
jgi:hypothetical protein